MQLSTSLSDNITQLNEIFPIQKSYDFITRNLHLQDTKAFWIGINGLSDSELLLKIFSDLQNPEFNVEKVIKDLPFFVSSKIGYIQTELCNDWDKLIKNILSGPSVLFIDGFANAIILDTRKYPARSIEEPDSERVTRGAKDGFVEILVHNTALIRRRIRNPKLTFEVKTVGSETKSDVAIAYLDSNIDHNLLDTIRNKIDQLDVPALTMGPKSLEELIIKKRWYNPLPQIRYTQRPDVACSYLQEGYIAVIVDNFPSIMIFPCTFFQFTQNPEDYYQNPSVGNYLRFVRFLCILITLFAMPIFFLLGIYSKRLPDTMQVIKTMDLSPIKLFAFVLSIEIFLDIFRYSSANAASGLSHSLSLVGGLIIGDIAVELEWASSEVIFYGALTLLASLGIASLEFASALRLYRIFVIIMTGCFHLVGFIIGYVLVFLSIITTSSITGKNYFWPLYPFSWKALKTLLFRYPNARYQAKKR